MIRGVHTMFYSSEPEALRNFFRDNLGFSANAMAGGSLICPKRTWGVISRMRKKGPSRAPTTFRSTAMTWKKGCGNEVKWSGIHWSRRRSRLRISHPFQHARRLCRATLSAALPQRET